MSLIPMVVERDSHGERSYDLYSRMLKDRIMFFGTPIDDYVANVLIAQMLFLESEDEDKPIYMYINSPGGSVTSGLGVISTMKYVKPKIHTICIGQACSMASLILAAGDKRSSLPDARIMIHQVSGGGGGQSTDIQIQAKEIQRLRDILDQKLADFTGQKIKQVTIDTERDNFMSPEEAKNYGTKGIIDEIIQPRIKLGIEKKK